MQTLESIRAFLPMGASLATAGQPTEAQFRAIAAAGFKAVINLALPTSPDALANEGSIVAGLGLTYIHVPVDFGAPAEEDFETFSRILQTLGDRRVFVHCAMNMRVSAFLFLHRVLRLGVSEADARAELRKIWEPDGAWPEFIGRVLARSGSRPGGQT